MYKWPIGNIMLDKVILLIISIIVLVSLVGSIYLLENYAAMTKEWIMFVFFSILFILATTYKSTETLSRLKVKWAWTLLLLFLELVMILLYIIGVYYKIVSLPERGIFVWTFAVLVISYMTSSAFSLLVNKFRPKN